MTLTPDRALGRREGVRACLRMFGRFLAHKYTEAETRFVLEAWAEGLSVMHDAKGLAAFDPGGRVRPSCVVRRLDYPEQSAQQVVCRG